MSPNDEPRADLTPRDRQAASLVAAGRTFAEVATSLKVSTATMTRTARKPGFRELVAEIRNQAASAATGELIEGARAAVAELRRLATASDSDAVRVSAARSILEIGLKWRSAEQIEALAREVAEIRQDLEQAKQPLQATGLPQPATPTEVQTLAPPTLPPELEPSEPPAETDETALFE